MGQAESPKAREKARQRRIECVCGVVHRPAGKRVWEIIRGGRESLVVADGDVNRGDTHREAARSREMVTSSIDARRWLVGHTDRRSKLILAWNLVVQPQRHVVQVVAQAQQGSRKLRGGSAGDFRSGANQLKLGVAVLHQARILTPGPEDLQDPA